VSSAVRNIVILTGCLAVVAVGGILATTVLRTATVASTQTASTQVVVDTNDSGGVARLTVLAPVTFRSGGGKRVVAPGTQFTTTAALLTDALPSHNSAAVGDTLDCDLRVSQSRGQPVIDLVRCAPAKTSPRG
jgi:hypothetical protein